MNYFAYSVRDSKIGFGPIILEQSDASASRNFSLSFKDGLFSSFPGDFDLYKIGSFDLASGHFDPFSVPVLVCSGNDARQTYLNTLQR